MRCTSRLDIRSFAFLNLYNISIKLLSSCYLFTYLFHSLVNLYELSCTFCFSMGINLSHKLESYCHTSEKRTTFDVSLPMQMPNSTQSRLCLLVLLQKKYLYTCKNIVTKPDLDEFLSKLFELFIVICFVTYLLTNSFIYLFFYFVLCINAVNLFSIKKYFRKNYSKRYFQEAI